MSLLKWRKGRVISGMLTVLTLASFLCVSMFLQPSREQIKKQLIDLGIENSCQVLDCESSESCDLINSDEIQRIKGIEIDLLNDRCPDEIQVMSEISSEEEKMPLAFSIMAHRDFPQFLKLFEAIYRPQNIYCIQIDNKSHPKFLTKVKKLLSCLTENNSERAFISNRNISLVWQHSSLLEGDLACLEQLLVNRLPWEYYINIVGSEFPLISNKQLVSKLNGLRNGVGFVQTVYPHDEVAKRWKYSHILDKGKVIRTNIEKTPPPNGIKMMYGLKNVAISRKFSEFCINSSEAQDLRVWLKDVQTSIEHFFPTLALYYLSKIGIFPEKDAYELLNEWRMRRTIWFNDPYYKCYGQIKREICILSLADLPSILQMDGFMMNKFDSDFDFGITQCLSEMIYG